MNRVALTGGIATGKSYVRGRFDALGVPTIDADVLAREAVAPGTPELAAIVARFGPSVVAPDGALDRRALASLVFSNSQARHDLESIIHPAVRLATERWFESLSDSSHPFAIADIPLLYEAGRNRDFETVIVVACAPGTQLRRLMARNSLTEAEARQRLDAQMPIDEKVTRADHVIRTDGTFADTDRQVRQVYERLVGGQLPIPNL